MTLDLPEYFGPWISCKDATPERTDNAERLLLAVSALAVLAEQDGVLFRGNPATGTVVSGQHYGGFRPQDCPQGAPHSSHKEGLAVDLYDPTNEIDDWCMSHQDMMEQCGIYIESPDSTQGWSHWTIKAPGSGHRVFLP